MIKPSNLLILGLAYPPATGGAAIYTQLLAEGLIEQGFLGKIIILVEAYPGYPVQEILAKGQLIILRLFPFRSEMSRRNQWRYLKYAYQNLQLLMLPLILQKYHIKWMIVHTHYYYSPSLLPKVIKLIRQTTQIKLIADVRDPKLSLKRFSYLYIYDQIICSAQNVYTYLSQDSLLKPKLKLIPIPLKISFPELTNSRSCLEKFQLQEQKYLFSAGGILEEKNLAFTLSVVKKLHHLGQKIKLVIAGKNKDWNQQCEEASQAGWLKYIGVISHEEVLILAQKAALVINLSLIESPSRYILESIAIGANVLLPAGVPEFQKFCADRVVISQNLEDVAQQILTCLQSKSDTLTYDLTQHSLEWVIPQYLKLLEN